MLSLLLNQAAAGTTPAPGAGQVGIAAASGVSAPALGETPRLDFVCRDASGAASDADATPVVEAFEDDSDSPIGTMTVRKRSARSGNYSVAVPCLSGSGFEAGKSYNLVATATIGGVEVRAVLASFVLRSSTQDTLAAALAAVSAKIVTLSVPGVVASSSGPTNVVAQAGSLSSANGFYAGMFLAFTSGPLVGQAQTVTTYVGSTKTFTTAAFVGTPSANDTFILIGRRATS